MRYLLLIYTDQNVYAGMNEDEMQADMAKWWDYDGAIKGAGVSSLGEALQPTTTATTVVDDGGKPLVTDGPFAETREQLGGYYLVEAKDLDEATRIAARIPSAKIGSIEVRPIMVFNS